MVEIGQGKITRSGNQITVVSWGRHLLLCNEVADQMAQEGISVEVIDLRSIYPYDWQMIKASVQKTGRVLFVNEDTEVTNFAEHLLYRTTQELFYDLLARPRVLAGKNLPGIGLHPHLEDNSVPQKHEIADHIREIVREVP
jgi:2-oxoisovalerate dehydrogenase E1 component beta subunit